MPIKRGNGKRRGVNKGPAKLTKKRRSASKVPTTAGKEKKTLARVLSKLARFTFNSIAYTVCTFNIIPIKHKNGEYSLTSSKLHKFLNYSLLFLLSFRVLNIIYICFELLFQDFNTTTLMSLSVSTVFVLAGSFGCCSVLRSPETIQLANAWRQVLQVLEEVEQTPVDMFEDVALSIKVVGLGGIAVICPLVMSALPLVYPEVPVTMHYQMQQAFPGLPDIWTQLACFPFEFTASLFACLSGVFGACVLVISIDLLNVYGELMRRRLLNTAEQHHQMTRLFTFLKVYNGILDVWYKFVTPHAFFTGSSTITFCLYITFRHTELPIFIYCCYPYMALAMTFIEFGLCYDGLVVINATQETVSKLRSRQTKCFTRMSEEDRAAGLKWGKAMKPVVFSVGSFTEFNIAVPVGVMDEIINQLVFLLTL